MQVNPVNGRWPTFQQLVIVDLAMRLSAGDKPHFRRRVIAMARSNNNSNEAIEDGEEGLWSKAGHSLRQPIQAALYLVHILKARTEEPELSKVTGMLEAALNGLQGQIELLIELSRVDRFALSPVRLDNALNAASVLVGPICSARSVEFLCSKTDERVTSNERLLTLLGLVQGRRDEQLAACARKLAERKSERPVVRKKSRRYCIASSSAART